MGSLLFDVLPRLATALATHFNRKVDNEIFDEYLGKTVTLEKVMQFESGLLLFNVQN